MNIPYPRRIVLKLLATVVSVFFLLTLTALPALASAGKITEFTVPTPKSSPEIITLGPDGNLWFTETNTNKIGNITTSGTIREFPIPTPQSGPAGIAPGSDDTVWFADSGLTAQYGNQIGRITTP